MTVSRWLGHIERVDNEQMLKRVVNIRVERQRVRGQSWVGWIHGVKRHAI